MDATVPSTTYAGTADRSATGRGAYCFATSDCLCWKSIAAGTVAALGIQLVLSMIGAGALAARINPATDPASADSTTTAVGAAAWLVISGVISFGVGGMVAGATSVGRGPVTLESKAERSARTGMNGGLHGALAWCLAAVLGVLATTIAGSAIAGGAASGAGSAAGSSTMGTPSGSWSGWNVPASNSAWRVSGAAPATAGSNERGIVAVGPYGQQRTITESEARVMAEKAAEAASRATLVTGLAFAMAMAAAVIGGGIGRHRAAQRCGYVAA